MRNLFLLYMTLSLSCQTISFTLKSLSCRYSYSYQLTLKCAKDEPWVCMATTNVLPKKGNNDVNIGQCINVDEQRSDLTEFTIYDDSIATKNIPHIIRRANNNASFDLKSPREWLEYNEMVHESQGAYTVIRCDLTSTIDKSISSYLWGKDFHLNRLSNSFIQMINAEEEKQNVTFSQDEMKTAVNHSEVILNQLVHASLNACVKAEKSSSTDGYRDGSIKVAMLTVLWTLIQNEGNDRKIIDVRGHSFCNNEWINQNILIPKPIVASVAVLSTAKNKMSQLPSRYDNLPGAKLSSWCRLRRPIEQMFKSESSSIGEVILIRKMSDDKGSLRFLLLEGLTSNLFVVYTDGTLRTSHVDKDEENGGVLGGYARSLVIGAAKDLNIPIVYGPITFGDGENGLWKEAFTTSSIRIITPLRKILMPKELESASMMDRITLQEFCSFNNNDSEPLWLVIYRKIQYSNRSSFES